MGGVFWLFCFHRSGFSGWHSRSFGSGRIKHVDESCSRSIESKSES